MSRKPYPRRLRRDWLPEPSRSILKACAAGRVTAESWPNMLAMALNALEATEKELEAYGRLAFKYQADGTPEALAEKLQGMSERLRVTRHLRKGLEFRPK